MLPHDWGAYNARRAPQKGSFGDDGHQGLVMGFGFERSDRHLRACPGHAQRSDLRVGRQVAVEVAAAIAQPMAVFGEADAGHQDHVGHQGRALAGRDAAAVAVLGLGTIPGQEAHGHRVLAGFGQRQARAPCPLRLAGDVPWVKFPLNRPIHPQADRLQLLEHRPQSGLQPRLGHLSGVGGGPLPTGLPSAALLVAAPLVPLLLTPGAVLAQSAAPDDRLLGDAREAWRLRDRPRLLALRNQLIAQEHPLAPWAAYWYFLSRLGEAPAGEVDEFLARWPDSYVADRARNDWLLELGRRQDWATFLRIQPAFRMNDDREVSCLGVLARHRTGAPMEGPSDLREQARQFWWAQKDADSGCDAMARALLEAGVLTQGDVWRKLRFSIEGDKPRAVQQSARLLGDAAAQAVNRLMSQPQAFLQPKGASSLVESGDKAGSPGASIGPRDNGTPAKGKKAAPAKAKAKAKDSKKKPAKPTLAPMPVAFPPEVEGPLNLLALVRWAAIDPDAAAAALGQSGARERWHLRAEDMAWAWAVIGRWSAGKLQAEAPAHYERALAEAALAAGTRSRGDATRGAAAWSPDVLTWMARAGLRSATAGDASRWALVEQAIEAMPPELQPDSAWPYWKAKSLQAHARAGGGTSAAHEAMRQQARQLLARIAHPLTFYGQLAAEEL